MCKPFLVGRLACQRTGSASPPPDSGVTFTSANEATDPPIAVSRVHVSPFDTAAPLGTFTFTRTANE